MALRMASVSSVCPSPFTPSVRTLTQASVPGSARIAGGGGAGSAASGAASYRVSISPAAAERDDEAVAEAGHAVDGAAPRDGLAALAESREDRHAGARPRSRSRSGSSAFFSLLMTTAARETFSKRESFTQSWSEYVARDLDADRHVAERARGRRSGRPCTRGWRRRAALRRPSRRR